MRWRQRRLTAVCLSFDVSQSMKYNLVLIAVLSLAVTGQAKEQLWPMWRVSTSDATYDVDAPESVASKTPSWTPSKAECPLSLTDAIHKAVAWIEKQPAKFDEINIVKIELNRFLVFNSKGECGDKWYYRIDYALVSNGKNQSQPSFAILLDGTIVPPKVTRDK